MVVGGLLLKKGLIGNEISLDSISEFGIYIVLSGRSDKFINGCYLSVSNTNNYILQDAIDLESEKRLYRIRRSNEVWGSWKTISLT